MLRIFQSPFAIEADPVSAFREAVAAAEEQLAAAEADLRARTEACAAASEDLDRVKASPIVVAFEYVAAKVRRHEAREAATDGRVTMWTCQRALRIANQALREAEADAKFSPGVVPEAKVLEFRR